MYNIIAINKAEEIPMPTPEAGIVIANEPVIMPEEEVVALEEEVVAPEEEVIGVIEEVTGVVVEVTGVIEEMTGVDFIVGDKEYFSGMIQDLSGETLYNISGDVVGEIYVESGEMVPVDLSGVSLLPTPLSVVYPTQSIRLDQSGYITFNTLESVTTTGGEAGANYCSRIAYENLSSILKAGTWTWRETNDYLLQGDAEDLVLQGLENHTLLEVTSGEIANIFSSDNGTGYGFVYDVYSSFMNFETRVYHRITVVYADDGQRYVLDPLRGSRTTTPQVFADYIAYYDDEIDVRRYIGQAYSPSVINDQSMHAEDILKIFNDAGVIVRSLTGASLTGDEVTEEGLMTGEIFTGISLSGEASTGSLIDDLLMNSTGEVVSEENSEAINTGETIPTDDSEVVITGEIITEELSGAIEETNEAYFDRAYEKGQYDDKIVGLQKMLAWIRLYAGVFDGIYTDSVIESVYQYQLQENILTPQDAVSLRGYLGPSTRASLNKKYPEYKSYQDSLLQEIQTGTGGMGTSEIAVPETGQETLEEIGALYGVNIENIFDPLADMLGFSGLDLGTGLEIGTGLDLGTGNVCDKGQKRNKKSDICKKEHVHQKLKEKGYDKGKVTLFPTDPEVLVGGREIDLSLFDGELLVPLIMQSSGTLDGNIAEVEFPEGVLAHNKNGGKYKKTIHAPVFHDKNLYVDKVPGGNIISAMEVGNNEEIRFKDKDGNAANVIFRMPVPGKQEGDSIDIKSSEDGVNFSYLTTVHVKNINGQPYVIFMTDHFSVTVTQANNGTSISADKAGNSDIGSGRTALGNITIAERANSDFAKATNVTLILTAPNNWRFKSGVGIVTRVPTNANISAASIVVAEKTLTITITVGGTNKKDSLVLSGIQVQAITGSLLDTGNILRTSANPGTATIAGITNGVTNFGTLGQIAGSGRNLVISLPGQTFTPITGNTGTASDQSSGVSFVIPKITAIDQFRNIATTYSGVKTLSRTGSVPGTFTTGVTFAGGQSTTTLTTTLNQAKTGVTLKTTDGILTGLSSSVFDVIQPLAVVNYSSLIFYENSGTNNGSIANTIMATLSTGAFSSKVVSSGYVTISNIPAGLTGVFTLSGTNTVIIALSGNATSHASANNTGNVIISFLSGAFSGMTPTEVGGSTQAGISVQFYDDPYYVPGEQLRINGILSGGQFYDYSPIHRATTGYGSISYSTKSGETIMGPFNGSSRYVSVGTYTLTNYTMSAWFMSNGLSAWRTIIGQDGGTAFEISQNTSNKLNFYDINSTFISTTTIAAGTWYHMARVQSGTSTYMYINGVLENSIVDTTPLSSMALAVGRYSTSQYRSGNIDEVHIYDSALSQTQIQNLYMIAPSYTTSTVYTGTPTLSGLVNDQRMYSISLTISGVTYTGTIANNVWTVSNIGPLTSGTYNVQLNYMNVYGKTGVVMYTGGLIVSLFQSVTLQQAMIASGYATGASTIYPPVDSNALVGTANINFSAYTGNLLIPTILHSSNIYGGQLAEIEIPAGAVLQNAGGTPFVGTLNVPLFNDPADYSPSIGTTAISAMSVGSTNHIYFKDTGNNDMNVIFRMPVPGRSEGELIDVYSSENGSSFEYLTTTHVYMRSGAPYITFIGNHFSVLVTAASSGTNVSADKAVNSYLGSGWTALGKITIQEQLTTDFAASQTNATLILTAPSNRQFKSGSCVAYGNVGTNYDVTAATYATTSTTLTITFSTDSNANKIDAFVRSGCQVQAITGSLLGTGNILRTSANPGTATIAGITNNVTNFGTLGQVAGSGRNLVITLSGQTFAPITGNTGTGINQMSGVSFVIPKITAIDQFRNIATTYSGAKTLSRTGSVGGIFTTGVSFSAGQSTTTLTTTLNQVKTGVTLKATDGTLTGLSSSAFDVLEIAALSYLPKTFYENTSTYDGTISGNITVTLAGTSFSSTVVSSGYVTISNVPAGLTSVFTLSGTNKIIITLSGTATNHAAANSTSGLVISFLTGAFVDKNPSEVINSTQTGIAVQFYDYTVGEQFRVNGTSVGTRFYDVGPYNTLFTGYGNAATETWSGESVMRVDGIGDYIENSKSVITDYPFTMSVRAKRSRTATTEGIFTFGKNPEATYNDRRGIAFQNSGYPAVIAKGTDGTEQITTAASITPIGERVHIAVVFNSATNRQLYVNGVLVATGTTSPGSLSTGAAQNRRIGAWAGQTTHNFLSGRVDEARLFNTSLDATQVESLYMQKPSYVAPKILYNSTGTLTGLVNDPKMYSVTLTISGTTYTGTIQSGVRSNTVGPLAAGTYDVQLKYMNVYGATGSLYYTGGLIVSAPSISYSSLTFYENSGTNNGSISGNITATLTGGVFSSTVVSSGYVTISNVPAGLTGVFTLSGSNQVVVTLSGNATSHASANSVNNLIVSFLTGAFSGMNPSEVINSTQTGIAIQFYDDQYYIGGGQLRLDGSLSGAGFDDLTDMHITTGAGGISNSIWTGEIATETVIGSFNGSSKYVSIGNYTLSNYTIATWIKTDDLDSYHPIITNGSEEFIYLYTDNKITLPSHGSLKSTTTLGLGTRYHVALVQSGGSVSLYVDGKEQASGTTTFNINNLALYAGYNPSYTEYWQGLMDEVHIYSGGITSGQIYNLYMKDPSFTPRSTITATTDLRGSAPDSQMVMSVEIDRIVYPITNNQDGTRKALAIGPLASGVYDVQLNYMNVYGKTGMIYYTGGLTVNPIIRINYNPETPTSGNVIATVTGYQGITGAYVVNNGGSPNYTFTGNGSFTFQLMNASGDTISITAIVDWIQKAAVSYSTGIFYEDIGLNNGSIANTIVATITDDTFSSDIINSGLIQMTNIPAGLTGVFTLSGTNKVIIALSGTATSHAAANSTSGLIITFLTGAFVDKNPSEVLNSTQTGIAVQFYDDPSYIAGGQLRLDGSLSGAGFDDLTDTHITTGVGGISNSTRTGEIATETVIGPFNGSTQYVSIGNYTLSNYAIATWIKTDDVDSYHPIITNGSEEFIYLYTDNKITLPSHGSLKSTTTLGLGTRYHVALVQSGGSVSLYVDGKEQASGTTTFSLNNLALYLGYNPNYTEYRQGLMDEVHIYSGGITSGQIYNLYMKDPSFTPRSTITATPDLRGLAPDPKMTIGLTIDGKNYSATNNQDGTRSALHIGPLASGVYDVQVNYMNVYGKTGVLYYTGGLTVNPLIYIEYAPETQTSGNVVATVTGYQSITGAHVTNNGGSPNYTFTSNGSFTFELANASGDTISITAIVDWIQKAEITYSTDSFYENTGLNDGSIANAMVATLTNDTFSSDIITNGLIQMTNIPAGLTGKYTLSGNTQLIIELTGSAINHNSDDGVYDITLSFLTGAFSTYMPGEVKGSTKTDIHLHFYDALIGSGTLRLDGSYSGTNYYDLSNTNITTGTAVITGLSQSGETIMGFNGSTSYIDIGTYTLPEYSMSAWIYRSNMSTSYQSIIARNGVGTSFEISTYNNLINLYSNGGLQSTVTIQSGQRYHIAVVKDTVGTKLYVNGELNNSNTFTGGLSATALAVGRWNTSQYRSGNIDEVHIYDDTLSATQVKNLYLLEPSYAPTTIYTDTTTLTGLVNDPKMYSVNVTISGTIYTGSIQSGIRSNAVGPLATGIYDVQINYMNVYGKTGTLYFTGGLIVTTESTGSLTISGPVSFDFGGWDASTEMFSIEKTFSGTNDYFEVIDTLGADTGYYTTISISNMTNGEGDIISSSAMAVKSLTGIVTLLGTDNPRIYSAITGAYQYFSGPPLTFIARDTAANGGVKGTYGLHTIRKIDIPALQDPGNYTGVITYTLY